MKKLYLFCVNRPTSIHRYINKPSTAETTLCACQFSKKNPIEGIKPKNTLKLKMNGFQNHFKCQHKTFTLCQLDISTPTKSNVILFQFRRWYHFYPLYQRDFRLFLASIAPKANH